MLPSWGGVSCDGVAVPKLLVGLEACANGLWAVERLPNGFFIALAGWVALLVGATAKPALAKGFEAFLLGPSFPTSKGELERGFFASLEGAKGFVFAGAAVAAAKGLKGDEACDGWGVAENIDEIDDATGAAIIHWAEGACVGRRRRGERWLDVRWSRRQRT